MPAPIRPRRRPIRTATTVVATVIVLVAVALAAAGTLFVLRWAVHRGEDTTALNRASDIAEALTNRGPGAAADLATEPAYGVDLARIALPSGQVLAARPARGIDGIESLTPRPDGGPSTREITTSAGVEYRVTTIGVGTPAGPMIVQTGTDARRDDTVLGAVTTLLVAVVPAAGLLTALFVWIAMGRVLRPVESLRSRVAEISTSGVGERVPVPPAEDEISRLARTMNEMLGRLDASRQAQVAFVGDASHELRSPLSTLSTLLELSSTSGRPVDVETVDQLMLPEVMRMRAMVEDLLLLAKSDERGRPLRTEDVDLDDLVLAEASRLRSIADVEVHVTVEPARLDGDPDALLRVMRNVVENARRHAAHRIDLALTVDGRDPRAPRAIVTVDDDGPGVPPEQRAHVFDRFARLDADRARGSGGSGLGLAIVAEITRIHGGTVTVGDSPTGGARFVIELPVQPPLAPDDEV